MKRWFEPGASTWAAAEPYSVVVTSNRSDAKIRCHSVETAVYRCGMQDESSVHLVSRWRAGDQQAAAELFRRYASRLIALAQSRLSASMASRVDPEDVVQSVYRSFFTE